MKCPDKHYQYLIDDVKLNLRIMKEKDTMNEVCLSFSEW